MKKLHFTLDLPMRLRNYMPTGSRSTTGKPTTCTAVTAFGLTGTVRYGEGRWSAEKLRGGSARSHWGSWIGYIWVISRVGASGGMLNLACNPGDSCCSRTKQRIM